MQANRKPHYKLMLDGTVRPALPTEKMLLDELRAEIMGSKDLLRINELIGSIRQQSVQVGDAFNFLFGGKGQSQ